MRRNFFLGVVVLVGLAGTACASFPSAAQRTAFNVSMNNAGCPELKLDAPLFVYIHERFKANQMRGTLTINRKTWAMDLEERFLAVRGKLNDFPESLDAVQAPAGSCEYQYVKGNGSFTVTLKPVEVTRGPGIREDKGPALEQLRGYMRELKLQFPTLSQNDFLSVVKDAFK
ncbi:MAG: hypothetical protein C0514_00550 [Candidatus Puniceispirillum sp.]|nr:hypothetical protein [Candidatus Puniceispirillum sp.]